MFKKYISSVLAGVAIAIGGYAFLKAENRVVGSFLFSIGLLLVCVMNYSLYTGKICFIIQAPKKISYYLIVFFGNTTGAFLVGKLTRAASPILIERANKLCNMKAFMGEKIILLGIMCNVMIYYAVRIFKSCHDSVGRYVGLILCVAIFVHCGFEHCIANIYYFSVANFIPQSFGVVLLTFVGNTIGGILIDVLDTYRK